MVTANCATVVSSKGRTANQVRMDHHILLDIIQVAFCMAVGLVDGGHGVVVLPTILELTAVPVLADRSGARQLN
jgi:hypothetical protein